MERDDSVEKRVGLWNGRVAMQEKKGEVSLGLEKGF